jgi:hypothetical protein
MHAQADRCNTCHWGSGAGLAVECRGRLLFAQHASAPTLCCAAASAPRIRVRPPLDDVLEEQGRHWHQQLQQCCLRGEQSLAY